MEAAQLKQDGRVKKVVVTGCLAQRYADELAGDGRPMQAGLRALHTDSHCAMGSGPSQVWGGNMTARCLCRKPP